jgi:hypothetical protein
MANPCRNFSTNLAAVRAKARPPPRQNLQPSDLERR